MNFLKRLFGIGSDDNDRPANTQRKEQPSMQPTSSRSKSESRREEAVDPQTSSSARPRKQDRDQRRSNSRRKSDGRAQAGRRNETERENRSAEKRESRSIRRTGSDEGRRSQRGRKRRPSAQEQQRPRATELSQYVLSTDEVIHDEESDKWRSLDFRKLDTQMPGPIPSQEIPEGADLPDVMREAIEKSLVWVSFDEELPTTTYDEDGNRLIGGTEEQQRQPYFAEPSTIWTEAPISEGEGGRLKYSPTYLDLTEEQRYEYLDWLTRKDKSGKWGYVFLYYNGLERHLLVGDLDRAVEEILRLRETFPWQHKLINASEYAVINSCFARHRKDLLLKLMDEGAFSGISLLQMTISYESDINLSSEDLLNIFYKLYPEARTALHNDRDRLRDHVENALNKLTLYDGLPIYRYPIEEVRPKNEHRFLNDSFPEYLRGCVMPDFYSLEPFRNDVDLIFHTAFDAYKATGDAQLGDDGEDEDDTEDMD